MLGTFCTCTSLVGTYSTTPDYVIMVEAVLVSSFQGV